MDRQHALQAEVIGRVTRSLKSDDRVNSVWLGGSLGRGAGDALSDIDLVVVTNAGQTAGVVASLVRLIECAGLVSFVHHAPWNAPQDGAQLNVLYDTEPLPIYVDWNVWPPVARKPRDVETLFERNGLPLDARATVASTGAALPATRTDKRPDDNLDRFRLFMTPIIVKYAVRGNFSEIDRMLRAMRVEAESPTGIDEVLALGETLVQNASGAEAAEAIACVRRYLAAIAEHVA